MALARWREEGVPHTARRKPGRERFGYSWGGKGGRIPRRNKDCLRVQRVSLSRVLTVLPLRDGPSHVRQAHAPTPLRDYDESQEDTVARLHRGNHVGMRVGVSQGQGVEFG